LNDRHANEQHANERDAFNLAGDVESDERTLDAVLRRPQILTESSRRVSEALKAAYPRLSRCSVA